jgi:hypothetical protein
MAVNASFDAQFLNIPIRALFINGALFPVVVREVTVSRSAGAHDAISMSVLIQGELTFDGNLRLPVDEPTALSRTRDVSPQSLPGQPVNFTYGVAPQVEQFYGYVVSITPDQQFKQGLNFVITMVGATLALQQVNRRFYTNVSIPQLVKKCVDRAGLGFDLAVSDSIVGYQWPSLGVTTETDWSLINGLANWAGCLVFNWNGVVRLADAAELFRMYPFTSLVSSDDVLESDRKLMDFKPTEQTAEQVSKAPQVFYFFDGSGTVVSHKQPTTDSNPQHVPFYNSPVKNRQEAELYSNASAKSMSRWLQNATARIKGDASIYPGVTVEINTGTRSATAKYNGRWLVVSVKHSMKRDAFATELALVRPGASIPTLVKSSFEHFWRNSPKARPALALRSDKWMSSWAEPYVEVAV